MIVRAADARVHVAQLALEVLLGEDHRDLALAPHKLDEPSDSLRRIDEDHAPLLGIEARREVADGADERQRDRVEAREVEREKAGLRKEVLHQHAEQRVRISARRREDGEESPLGEIEGEFLVPDVDPGLAGRGTLHPHPNLLSRLYSTPA